MIKVCGAELSVVWGPCRVVLFTIDVFQPQTLDITLYYITLLYGVQPVN